MNRPRIIYGKLRFQFILQNNEFFKKKSFYLHDLRTDLVKCLQKRSRNVNKCLPLTRAITGNAYLETHQIISPILHRSESKYYKYRLFTDSLFTHAKENANANWKESVRPLPSQVFRFALGPVLLRF